MLDRKGGGKLSLRQQDLDWWTRNVSKNSVLLTSLFKDVKAATQEGIVVAI
jgi:hypothetical protein